MLIRVHLILSIVSSLFLSIDINFNLQAQDSDFVTFESGHVRPLALSESGDLLYAVNTPDNRLEIYDVSNPGLPIFLSEIFVGLEPVAVVASGDEKACVVNHLSDSVSVIDLSNPSHPKMEATLQVGDEPRDAVIAGSSKNKLFVSTAHRGQNLPSDPQLTSEGVGRADVWVFQLDDLSKPADIITLFTDTPRGLAATEDGSRVYVAGFHTGNQTTCLTARAVSSANEDNNFIDDDFSAPGMPPPLVSGEGVPAPEVGLIVGFDRESGKWEDDQGRDWSPRVRFNLPDQDVFALDANQSPPSQIDAASHVGTILFNLAVHPQTGKVYSSNLESLNRVRFEPEINGHVAENRVTIIDFENDTVQPVHLNPHIDYSTPSGPEEEIQQSLAFPTDLTFSSDGNSLYVAALGSSKVAILNSDAQLVSQIKVSPGPSGLALDESGNRLFVMSRFDHKIDVIDVETKSLLGFVPLRFNPEPEHVQKGRPILYNAENSGHGDSACFSCHIYGDLDSLAWNLGDPDGVVEDNPLERVAVQSNLGDLQDFHPMKGPMTTQSLRGMKGAGAMHWRGDRNGVNSGAEEPDVNDEGQAFLHFRGAFQSLLGMANPLPEEDMEAFKDFILEVAYPPNPIAQIDGSLTTTERRGKQVFDSDGNRFGIGGDGDACAACHTLPFGTDGKGSFELESQEFKVPHLRNLYQKVGMFGYAAPDIIREPAILAPTPTPHLGDQIRGFGFLHDGSIPTLFNFFRVNFTGIPPFTFPDSPGRTGIQKVRELEAFLLAFPTGQAPVVGQQLSTIGELNASANQRLAIFIDRAEAGDCDLIVHTQEEQQAKNYLLQDGQFLSWIEGESLSKADLLSSFNSETHTTFTAVPKGSGMRMVLDRDRDGFYDGDELANGSNPADPTDIPQVRFLRGNCNGDDAINLADPIEGLLHLFVDARPLQCEDACDANAQNGIDISDMIYLLDYLFLGGPQPGAVPNCEEASVNCAEAVCPE